jgi:hypothetical protein
VENKGFWALEAPPKRAKQMNARGLFIGWQDTGVHSNALPVFERSNPWCCGRTQHPMFARSLQPALAVICVRTQVLCVRTHT